jgi:hypothetical protein
MNKEKKNEKNISTIQEKKKKYARIQNENGHKGWQESAVFKKKKGTEAPHRF